MTVSSDLIAARLARVRTFVQAADIDALLITHLPNIRYLTGLAATAGAVLLLPRAAILVVDFRYVTAARALAAGLGGLVKTETFERSYDEALVELIRRGGLLRIGIEAAYLPVARFNLLSSALAAKAPLPLSSRHPVPTLVPTERLVEQARVIKDIGEIQALREGSRRLSGVAGRLTEWARAGRTEREVAEDIDSAMRAAGFSHPAFDTIVAAGPNSALPHAQPGDRRLQPGDPTVLDFGGVYDGYSVDMTRTVQLGRPSEALERLYRAVAEAQQAAIQAVRPGVAASAIDGAARAVLEREGLGEAFGHGTGHGLGLEVHEEPRITRPSPHLPDTTMEPGMVFTVEPGAYVPGLGGVRIEDDVLVTEHGCEVLTR